MPLGFRGELYRRTLMTPVLNPGRNPFGNPKIMVAAAWLRMTQTPATLGDVLLVRPFTGERYQREEITPTVQRCRAGAGRTQHRFEQRFLILVVTGRAAIQLAAAT